MRRYGFLLFESYRYCRLIKWIALRVSNTAPTKSGALFEQKQTRFQGLCNRGCRYREVRDCLRTKKRLLYLVERLGMHCFDFVRGNRSATSSEWLRDFLAALNHHSFCRMPCKCRPMACSTNLQQSVLAVRRRLKLHTDLFISSLGCIEALWCSNWDEGGQL